MKTLVYSRDALRSLDRMPFAAALRIREKLKQYAADPSALANNVKKLTGAEGVLRLRVGDWRVLFTETGEVVQIVRVAPRGSAYERL